MSIDVCGKESLLSQDIGAPRRRGDGQSARVSNRSLVVGVPFLLRDEIDQVMTESFGGNYRMKGRVAFRFFSRSGVSFIFDGAPVRIWIPFSRAIDASDARRVS
jgi:hypothetical protein